MTVQHQLTNTMSVEAAYVGNYGRNAFFGDNPATNANQPSIVGFATGRARPTCGGRSSPVTSPNAQGFGGDYGWTQRLRLLLQLRHNCYNSLQTKATQARSAAATRCSRSTHCSIASTTTDDYYFIDPNVNHGTANFDRTHTFTVLDRLRKSRSARGKRFMGDAWRGRRCSSAAGS